MSRTKHDTARHYCKVLKYEQQSDYQKLVGSKWWNRGGELRYWERKARRVLRRKQLYEARKFGETILTDKAGDQSWNVY